MNPRVLARDALARLPLLDVNFRRLVWSRRHFPEAEMRFLNSLPPGTLDVAIDVGAALGSYAWILNRKARRVIAFEPGKVHADFLARGLRGTRIELVRAAVGNASGTVPMYTPGSDTDAYHSATLNAANPIVQAPGVKVTQVPQVRLDDHLRQALGARERVDLIKVDVEGYELAVFEGAANTLARHRPLVICEIEARHSMEYLKVFQLLRNLGYTSFVWSDGHFRRFDGDDIAPMQREEDLAYRLSRAYRPGKGNYINNFSFEHPESKIKVSQ